MFQKFFQDPAEGMIRAEVGHGTLQGKRAASGGYPGTQDERPVPFSGLPVFLLKYRNYTESRVLKNFFDRCGKYPRRTEAQKRIFQSCFPPVR